MTDASLMTGWLPTTVLVIGLAGALYLLIRPMRWWWTWFVPAVVVVSGIAAWVIAQFAGKSLFAETLPLIVGVWIAVIIGAVLLTIGHMFASPWWEKVISVVAGIAVVAAAGNQINQRYQQYPKLGDLLGASSDQQITGPPPLVTTIPTSPSSPHSSTTPTRPTEPAKPLAQTWIPTGSGIPADGKGKTSEISLPGTISGFQARPGVVYYPPAYFADNAQPLPVLVIIVGQPGDPSDWFLGDRIQAIMNDFAASHNGIAPIVVSPDPLGSQLANPLCANSSLGQADTYLSQDVPNGIKQQLRVQTDPRGWAIGGFSYGGTCAMQMAVNHPDVYPTFIDISGEIEPTLGSQQETIDAAFGGDAAKFRAINPIDILATKKFPNTAGWIIVGSDDTDYKGQQQQMYAAALGAGMAVQYWESPGTGHDWGTASAGMSHVMNWLAQRMNLI